MIETKKIKIKKILKMIIGKIIIEMKQKKYIIFMQ